VTRGQTIQAFTAAWLILSAVGLLALLAALLLPEGVLLSVGEALRSEAHGPDPCVLCGMTRAFAAMARGDLTRAVEIHRGSVPLAGILFANAVLAGLHVATRIRAVLRARTSRATTRGARRPSNRSEHHAAA